jgi:hypothetical protein
MAKDPSKKGVRKIPKEFLDWIENTYNKETAAWYKTNAGRSKAWASKDRINLSEEVGKVGAYHEGHFQGAKDFDLKTGMGGGPTTGRTMRSEIGVLNVAHSEKPRIPKAEMRRLGIPQYWIEDFYEALLEAENLKVIGNLDRQAALDIDAGMPIEQAAAQSRMRDDLRRQGMTISGSRPTYQTKPAPLPQNITQQAIPPEFDVSEIKTTGEVRVKPRTRRIPKVPQNPVEFVQGVQFKGGKAVLSALPIVGAAFDVGDVQAGVQAYTQPTQTPMQQFGAGLQAVSGATGLAALVPSPASPALGAASLITGGAAAAVQSGAVFKAIQAAPKAVKTVSKVEQTLNPVSRAITNELKYIGGKVMLGKLPYFN